MAKIKERPILFSSEMVRAILDGRKTETRRVMNPQPSKLVTWLNWAISATTPKGYIEGRGNFPSHPQSRYGAKFFKSPYGMPGDILYVRETFLYRVAFGGYLDKFPAGVLYRADFGKIISSAYNWKPSIHMPKKFSRIKLKIKEIQVERIQDIKPWDCIREGVPQIYSECPHGTPSCATFTGCFEKTWDSLNKKRGFGWETNCFVWVIKFERIK